MLTGDNKFTATVFGKESNIIKENSIVKLKSQKFNFRYWKAQSLKKDLENSIVTTIISKIRKNLRNNINKLT